MVSSRRCRNIPSDVGFGAILLRSGSGVQLSPTRSRSERTADRPGTQPRRGILPLPVEVARARYLTRASSRHPVHVATTISEEKVREFDRPLALGPVLEVDTTQAIDIPSLCVRVKSYLRAVTAA